MGCLKLTYREELPTLRVVKSFSFSLEKSSAGVYRYGFQGQEKDDEVSGSGNSYTTEFRQYDSRLGRWKSLDPKRTAWESPYASMSNNPILFSDPLGDTIVISLFSPNDWPLIKVANKALIEKYANGKNDGVFIVLSHANPETIWNKDPTNGFPITVDDPKILWKILEANEKWNEAKEKGIEITLILTGCNLCTTPKDYPDFPPNKVLSDEPLGVRISKDDPSITVKVADGLVQYDPIEKGRLGTIGNIGDYGVSGVKREENKGKGNDGGFVTLKGGVRKGKVVVGNRDKAIPGFGGSAGKKTGSSAGKKANSKSKPKSSRASF